MSSNSSRVVLHLVEHVGEGRLQPQRLLDLIGRHVRVLAVLQEARDLVLADELDERLRVLLPILGEPFEIGEDGRDAGRAEQGDRVLGVLVEVGVEDALVLEVQAGADVEQLPAQVVQAQAAPAPPDSGDRCPRSSCRMPGSLLAALLDLRDDREAVAGRRPRKDRAVPPPLELRNIPPFGMAIAAGLVQSRSIPDIYVLLSACVRSTGHYLCSWLTNPYRRRQCRVGDDRFVAVHPPGSVESLVDPPIPQGTIVARQSAAQIAHGGSPHG